MPLSLKLGMALQKAFYGIHSPQQQILQEVRRQTDDMVVKLDIKSLVNYEQFLKCYLDEKKY